MLKVFYIPKAEEFHPGFEFEKQPFYFENNTVGEFAPMEFSAFSMDLNYILLELGKGRVRVRHLHEDDFKKLGMTCDLIPKSENASGHSYLCSAKINHPRKDVPVKMDIYYTPSSHWVMITLDGSCMFAGVVLNISELKRILKQIQADGIIVTKG